MHNLYNGSDVHGVKIYIKNKQTNLLGRILLYIYNLPSLNVAGTLCTDCTQQAEMLHEVSDLVLVHY